MVYELYQINDDDGKTAIFAVIQTITMSVKIIGLIHDVEAWMNKEGLTKDNGWDLSEADDIHYKAYNELISCNQVEA